ncbi:MAG: chemotaxis protein CheB [Paludibacter sp.]|nr:chemotaxis protein CheB [Paludibacter sp.]
MKEKSKKTKTIVSSKVKPADSEISQFPIVCVGASAGGLEALEQFLGNVPENSGMGYIVIQHLDPTQKGMLPELLQRITRMEVVQVEDRMPVMPNRVYVIPPNKSMSILKGTLHLFDPVETRGLRLPIDFFLRSLAEDLKELAVGVILSGMGSDGSIGCRSLKEKNGIVMVQEPTNAKFDSMPRNVIDSVLVDIVAPANELPVKLQEFMKNIPLVKFNMEVEIKDQSSLEKIIILLRNHTGNDFSLYKKNTVYRRIERRMSVHNIEKISNYVTFLQENLKEVDILFKELLIGVTNFFRDSAVWENMANVIIPAIISKQQEGAILRAWVAGCSTGEEAYSLAIVFKEAVERIVPHGGYSLQIFATDLDNEAIETARKGLFPLNIAADVSPKRLSRFFVSSEDGYRINAEIREMVVFAKHNIILHPPFTKVDILTCRNLLIYMDAELQKKLFGLFYYSLNNEGYMVLGSAESLGSQSHFFETIDNKLKIFQRSHLSLSPVLIDFPSSFARNKQTTIENQKPLTPPQNIQTLANELLLQHFSPPGVLVNDKGDIIYISGRTGKYLEPAVGKANMNIFAMLRDGLRNEFPSAFRQALSKKEPVIMRNIMVGTNGGTQLIRVNIQWLDKPLALKGMVMIIFIDEPISSAHKEILEKSDKNLSVFLQTELEKELQIAREDTQNTLEEMQTSQEELKSTNEELQSTNEELQSTNEELTTSKEEMQSLNEELQTVNAELQSKIDDFTRVNNDMKNLLNSTDIATLFLDKDLNIRRYTDQATKIFKLIKSDIGRPFTDQASDLIYPDLANDAREVLRTLVFVKKQIETKDGRWFSTRIMPYRTFDDRIDGLVITFFNITDLKQLEEELHDKEQVNQMILNISSDVIIKVSNEWKILEFNPSAERFFGKNYKETVAKNFIQLFVPDNEQKKTENDLNRLMKEGQSTDYKMPVFVNEKNKEIVDWTVNVHLNSQKIATEMIIIAKNNQSHE